MTKIWWFTDNKLISDKPKVDQAHCCTRKGRASQDAPIQQRSYCKCNCLEKMQHKLQTSQGIHACPCQPLKDATIDTWALEVDHRCMYVVYLGNSWNQGGFWEEGKGRVMLWSTLCWENFGPERYFGTSHLSKHGCRWNPHSLTVLALFQQDNRPCH